MPPGVRARPGLLVGGTEGTAPPVQPHEGIGLRGHDLGGVEVAGPRAGAAAADPPRVTAKIFLPRGAVEHHVPGAAVVHLEGVPLDAHLQAVPPALGAD
jgi:hypothetical protein